MDELTVYDWPPSAPDEEHEFTYLIIDLRGEPGAGPPYRVSVVNGDRLLYEVESALVADLNTIEASSVCRLHASPARSGAVATHSFLLEVSCETKDGNGHARRHPRRGQKEHQGIGTARRPRGTC